MNFYFQKKQMEGIYHPDGSIEWTTPHSFDANTENLIKKQIHELMLFHVYDNR